jgi:flavin reductase (DIM6/NTAB) family NADH-FMN oxidoreductase RutF
MILHEFDGYFMKTIDPTNLNSRAFYKYMTAAVAPRPIALASTIDHFGRVNLSPFSFFNMMGIDPPILVFAPNRKSTDHSQKHTALNVYEVPEVTINLVNSAMVQQISLASAEFERGVNEFEKAGFTAISAIKVMPPRVQESPAQFECKVIDIREYGSMTLIIVQVILAHFSEHMLNKDGQIDQRQTDWVARLGGDWYLSKYADQLFEIPRPKVGIGFDALPDNIRYSAILTGNELAQLACVSHMPDEASVAAFGLTSKMRNLRIEAAKGCQYFPDLLHVYAKQLLGRGNVTEAWLTLLQAGSS